MLALADKGDNSSVDMLVGDIYGADYQKIGLKSSTIASSFGKVFRKDGTPATESGEGDPRASIDDDEARKAAFKPEDISRSLLYAISNNIGQIACVLFLFLPALLDDIDARFRRYMNAEKHNLDRIYFGGGFIRDRKSVV